MSELKVNGEIVSPSSIEQERQQLLKDLSLKSQNVSNDRLKLMILDRARQNVIDHYLCKQEAERRGIVVDESEIEQQVQSVAQQNGGMDMLLRYLGEINESLDDFRTHIKNRMLVDALVEQIHQKVSLPKDRAAKKFFKEHKEQFSSPERAEVEHIVKRFKSPVEKRKVKVEIDKIHAALVSGKSFKLMVKQRSDNPVNEGKFGWVEKGKLGVLFDDFIFSSEAGALSAPLESADAWYLIKVVDKEEAVQRKFDEVKADILFQLAQTDRQEAVKAVLAGLQKSAVVEE